MPGLPASSARAPASVGAWRQEGWQTLLILGVLTGSALAGVVAVQIYLRLPVDPVPVITVTSSALFIYGTNRLTDLVEDSTNDPRRRLMVRHTLGLVAASTAVLVGMIGWLTWHQRRAVFFYLAVLAVGVAYSFRVIPWPNRDGRWLRLKDVLVLKSVVVAAVWTASLFLAPLLHLDPAPPLPAPFLFLGAGFCVAYYANVVFCDLRDEPGDRAAGVTTMPVRFGARACYRTIAALGLVSVAIALLAWRAGWIDGAHVGLLACADLGYPAAMWFAREKAVLERDTVDYLVESIVPLFALGLILLRLVRA